MLSGFGCFHGKSCLEKNVWPQMNTDERRCAKWNIGSVICITIGCFCFTLEFTHALIGLEGCGLGRHFKVFFGM